MTVPEPGRAHGDERTLSPSAAAAVRAGTIQDRTAFLGVIAAIILGIALGAGVLIGDLWISHSQSGQTAEQAKVATLLVKVQRLQHEAKVQSKHNHSSTQRDLRALLKAIRDGGPLVFPDPATAAVTPPRATPGATPTASPTPTSSAGGGGSHHGGSGGGHQGGHPPTHPPPTSPAAVCVTPSPIVPVPPICL